MAKSLPISGRYAQKRMTQTSLACTQDFRKTNKSQQQGSYRREQIPPIVTNDLIRL